MTFASSNNGEFDHTRSIRYKTGLLLGSVNAQNEKSPAALEEWSISIIESVWKKIANQSALRCSNSNLGLRSRILDRVGRGNSVNTSSFTSPILWTPTLPQSPLIVMKRSLNWGWQARHKSHQLMNLIYMFILFQAQFVSQHFNGTVFVFDKYI